MLPQKLRIVQNSHTFIYLYCNWFRIFQNAVSPLFTVKFIIFVNESFRQVLTSNFNLSCCRAGLLNHSQMHIKQPLTITNRIPWINSPVGVLFCSFSIYSTFFFSSPDQVPELVIPLKNKKKNTVAEYFPSWSPTHWSCSWNSSDLCVCSRPLCPSSFPAWPVSSHLLLVMTGRRPQWLGGVGHDVGGSYGWVRFGE